jgi:predicted SAM-dependent methyltransferase
MTKKYLQFGCGSSNPESFINYDSSFNLYIQRSIFRFFWHHKVKYPDDVLFGDVVKGLPVTPNSMKGIYSSHVIEHLSYNDCRRALRNCFSYLEKGGIFRCVLPNIEAQIKVYLMQKEASDKQAANKFMRYTFLGYEERPSSIRALISWYLATDKHFWMWDYDSLSTELLEAGFSSVKRSSFNMSADPVFNTAEDPSRFEFSALCLEAIK